MFKSLLRVLDFQPPPFRNDQNRPLLDDLQTMLCADALAMGRTSLNFLTFGHTRATTIFVPSQCGKGNYRIGDLSHKATYENTTLLVSEKPDGEIYGIDWGNDKAVDYTVYEAWHDTPPQLMEIVSYDDVKGLQRCTVHGGGK